MKFWKLGLVACLLVLAGGLGWRFMYPSYEWRQKITVEVDTPQGPVSGSSVAEIAWWGVPKILPEGSPRDWSVKAEAVVVPLPDGKYLFALVKSSEFMARAVLFDPPYGGDPYLKPASQVKHFKGEVHDIPPRNYPRLVTFDDISDPVTAKRVDPDDLDAAFGCSREGSPKPWRDEKITWAEWRNWQATGLSLNEWNENKRKTSFRKRWEATMSELPTHRDSSSDCYRIKRITLEITDEPVTEGEVEIVLKPDFFKRWARIHHEALDRGGIRDPYFGTFASDLRRNSFIRE